MFNTPILFLIFNRPKLTEITFKRIREIQPSYLYIAADGPRQNKPEEVQLCQKARFITEQIDWPCEVKRLYRKENLGCGLAVSNAITWFFEEVEEGIILEDDCLADVSFFKYCETLLEKYRNNTSIMHIGGSCSILERPSLISDYFFSAYNHIWGWATWRRAWNYYSFEIIDLDLFVKEDKLNFYFDDHVIRKQWYAFLNKMNIDTWDYQWTYAIWKYQGISILPKVNLIQNIGFDQDAVHTKDSESIFANIPTRELKLEFNPDNIFIDKELDKKMTECVFNLAIQNCPLTNSSDIEVIRKIKTSWLINQYQKNFAIDISEYLRDLDYISLIRSNISGYRYFYPLHIGGDNLFYQSLQDFPWYYMPWKWEHFFAIKYIKSNDKVLEIGSARGDFLRIGHQKTNANYTGLELNSSAFLEAKKIGLDVYNETIEHHSKNKNNYYDIVCSFQVLEHISDVKSFLSEQIGILRSGGKLIIGVPDADSFTKEDIDYDILNMPPHHMGWWNKASLSYLAKLFSLEIVSIKNEPLQKQHFDWYIRNMGIKIKSHPKIDFVYKKFRLGKIFKFLLPVLSNFIKGHTIVAVYRKK